MTNPIDPQAAEALTASPAITPPIAAAHAESDAPPVLPADQTTGAVARVRAAGEVRARRVATAFLDRVSARTAVVIGDDVASLRREIALLTAELTTTRRELSAEIVLLRAELGDRPSADDETQVV